MALGALDVITLDDVAKKQKDIVSALSYKFKDEEIDEIVKEKQRFKKNPHNYAARKTQLIKTKDMAELKGDRDEVQRLQEELDQLEERATELDRRRTSNISSVR